MVMPHCHKIVSHNTTKQYGSYTSELHTFKAMIFTHVMCYITTANKDRNHILTCDVLCHLSTAVLNANRTGVSLIPFYSILSTGWI